MKVIKFIFRTIMFILLFLGLLALSASKWYAQNYAGVPFAQVLYHIVSPLEGTQTDFLDGFMECLPMPIIVTLIAVIAYILLCKSLGKNKDKHVKRILTVVHIALPVLTCCTLVIGLTSLTNKMGVVEYIQNENVKTEFYDKYYVNPIEIEFTHPEKKRNLVYIFLESMEVTFEDKANGGLTETNFIPELTQLQNDNLVFNGGDVNYNGFDVPALNGWTVAGIVGQQAGVPVNVGEGLKNSLNSGDFLPRAYALGNILEDAGYTQEFMCGSDIEFGGRKNFLDQHGNYTYYDINYAKEIGVLPQDYGVWWGFEDEKLFDFAKDELNNLASGDEPFNFTMLTADTHFPYGYECEDCQNNYDKQYSNVMSCSSKRVGEFVSWIQQQEWYENTTIVICGDHKTMESDWFKDKDVTDYKLKAYYTIINPAIEPERTDARDICTYDLFPTTVAALGIQYDSDRLGLGTNLFGQADTLVEEIGMPEIDKQTSLKSDLYDDLFNNRKDLFPPKKETTEEETEGESEDISWQVPTYYTGDYYDYTQNLPGQDTITGNTEQTTPESPDDPEHGDDPISGDGGTGSKDEPVPDVPETTPDPAPTPDPVPEVPVETPVVDVPVVDVPVTQDVGE